MSVGSKRGFSSAGVGLSDTDYRNFPTYVPDSLKFTSSKQGLAARRIPVKIRSEQQSNSSNNNNIIRIAIPNNAIYDTRFGYLTFTVTINTIGGTYKRLHSGVFTVFNRLRIRAGTKEIEDIIDYNDLYSKLWEMKQDRLITGNFGTSIGYGSQVDRDALGAIAAQPYACPLYSGVLNTELLPTHVIQSGLFIDLYIENAAACVETDGTSPTITISDVILHIERLELDPSYSQFITNYVQMNGLRLGFPTWQRFVTSLTAGQQQNIILQIRNSSVNGILNFFVNSNIALTTTQNDKFLNWTRQGLTTSQTIVNGTVFPEEPIDCVTNNSFECYQGYCRWAQRFSMNLFMNFAAPIVSSDFAVNRFVQIDDFEPYPEENNIINPFTTITDNSPIIKKLTFSAPIPAGFQLNSWVEFFKQILIQSNGLVVVIE